MALLLLFSLDMDLFGSSCLLLPMLPLRTELSPRPPLILVLFPACWLLLFTLPLPPRPLFVGPPEVFCCRP